MQPSQNTIRSTYTLSDAEIERCLQRADKQSGLLAVPQPPRWPLFAVLICLALALAGLVGLRHADLKFVRFQLDRNEEMGR